MTTEKLTESIELEDYCLLKGYSIVYNRWVDAVVLNRDGIDYKFKEEVSDEKVLVDIVDTRSGEHVDVEILRICERPDSVIFLLTIL